MTERKELILNTILHEHIRTAEPVSSGLLVDKYKLDISPATVRNEMAELEEMGYIRQPHTSAGRIPTEKAYEHYISKMKEKKPKETEMKIIGEALADKEELDLKQTAKVIAGLTEQGVFWAFHKHNVFYTGVSNMFLQPEFREANNIYDISVIIDRLDEIINQTFDDINSGLTIKVGSQNPFSQFCGAVMMKYKRADRTGLFGILGPMRMDYERLAGLVGYVGQQL